MRACAMNKRGGRGGGQEVRGNNLGKGVGKGGIEVRREGEEEGRGTGRLPAWFGHLQCRERLAPTIKMFIIGLP